MPKARRGAGSGALFSIQPWQNKGDKAGDKGSPDDVEYTVVEEDLVPGPSATEPGPPRPAPPPAPRPAPPPWRSAVRRSSPDAVQAAPDAATSPPAVSHPPAPPPAPPPRRRSLTGTATLVALSESRLAGTFTPDSSGVIYPLHGRQITGYRECTRDDAWAVVTLRLLRLPGPELPAETVVVAERAGGDAMRLSAPVEWQGEEEAAVAAAAGAPTPGVGLAFQCERLLADAAADEVLAGMMPRAVGLGALVNVGRMEVTWGGGGGGWGGGGGGGGGRKGPSAAAPYDDDLDG